jgi:hypothetical protein
VVDGEPHVAALAQAFDDMLERLASERRDSVDPAPPDPAAHPKRNGKVERDRTSQARAVALLI